MPDALPSFKYHPHPLSTGAVRKSDATCQCCELARGFVYTSNVYCIAEVGAVCPWCIADGSAHAKWNAEFTDSSAVGGYGQWCDVPESVVDEVAHRTPGFATIQEAKWWTHCGDAGEFLGISEPFTVRFRCRVCSEIGTYEDDD